MNYDAVPKCIMKTDRAQNSINSKQKINMKSEKKKIIITYLLSNEMSKWFFAQ